VAGEGIRAALGGSCWRFGFWTQASTAARETARVTRSIKIGLRYQKPFIQALRNLVDARKSVRIARLPELRILGTEGSLPRGIGEDTILQSTWRVARFILLWSNHAVGKSFRHYRSS
jgi:hypothetical protein